MGRYPATVAVLSVAAGLVSAVSAQSASGTAGPPLDVGDQAAASRSAPRSIHANAVAIDPAGRLLVLGSCCTLAPRGVLVRYRSDGRLDPTFGTDGVVVTGAPSKALAIEPDGRIVVVGTGHDGFALARYDRDGSLDRTFGDGGRASSGEFDSIDENEASAVAIDHAGRIVVAGTGFPSPDAPSVFDVARFDRDGALDPTFGTDGKVVTGFPPSGGQGGGAGADAVAIEHSGNVVVAGTWVSPTSWDLALARYTPSGALDQSFGSGGMVTTDSGGPYPDFAGGVAIAPAGRIVVAGSGASGTFLLAGYTEGGALDSTFGLGGLVTTAFRPGCVAVANAVAIDPAGRIVAGGEGCGPTPHHDFALARYTPDGTLDSTFGAGGEVTTDFEPGRADGAKGLAIEPSGEIVAAGASGTSHLAEGGVGGDAFAVARYLPSGALDPAFRSGGRVRTTFAPNTRIRSAHIVAKKHKARFAFKAVGPATRFTCALISREHRHARFKRCRSPKPYRHLKRGRYEFEVRAIGLARADPTPAKRKFKIHFAHAPHKNARELGPAARGAGA